MSTTESESELSVIKSTSGQPLIPPPVAAERGWCSWCAEFTGQSLLAERLVTRNLMKCESCKHLTGKCMWCEDGFVRAYPDDHMDKLCFKCYHLLPSWGTPISALEEKKKPCSWCMQETNHSLYRFNVMGRNDYTCNSCGHLTVNCVGCADAMAKYVGVMADVMCAKCDGSIDSWETAPEDNKARLSRHEWCSWCVEKSNHTRVQTNILARHVYHCDNCQQRTLICISCQKAMAQGGPGWDDSLCLSCLNPSVNWVMLQQQKRIIFQKECTKEHIIVELKRDSRWRRRAVEQGMLRPFLLLVSMSPSVRLQTACLLGWAYITEPYFGDPHEEAGHILFDSITGVQTRIYSPLERLNPAADFASWREIVTRVHAAAFKAPIAQTDAKPLAILEEDFLAALQELRKRDMSKAQQEAEEREILADPQSHELAAALHENAGVTRPEVTQYAIKVTKKIAGISPLNMTIMSLELAATLVPEAAAELGAVAGALGTLVTPMAIIGMIGLIRGGFKLTLGSSEGRIFCPLVLMLHQRLMLGIEGINLEHYYTPVRREKIRTADPAQDIREDEPLLASASASASASVAQVPASTVTDAKRDRVSPAAVVPPAEVRAMH